MSENKEQKHNEKWELQEIVDDAIASEHWHPALVNEYVYEFKQGGRTITDLTAASYHQLALNRGIVTKSVERELMKEGVLYTVMVTNPEGQDRYGVAYAPFMANGKPDNFCFQKALTKATRNAIKQLVDATERLNAITTLKALPTQAKQALPKEQEAISMEDGIPYKVEPTEEDKRKAQESNADRVRKYCFAMWNEHQPAPKGSGKLPPDFWENVKQRYGVKSRETMTYSNWQACRDWIQDFIKNSPANTFSVDDGSEEATDETQA